MTDTSQIKKTQHFHSLDALRGIACVLVAIYHMTGMKWQFGGHMLVDFFLVLSGFVIAHAYLYRAVPVGKWEFVVRRFARMWPLHVFTLFFTFGAVYYPLYGRFFSEPGSNVYNTWTTLIQNITMTHNIGLPPFGKYVFSWNFPSWSISVEFWVNLLFIFVVTKATRSWGLVLASVICLAFVFKGTGTLGTYNENYYGFLNSGMLRGIASFALGIVAYKLFIRYQHLEIGRGKATILEWICVLLCAFFLHAQVMGIQEWEFVAPYFFALMVPFFACERGGVTQSIRHVQYLGVISYSIYLNHVAFWILSNYPPLRVQMAKILGTGSDVPQWLMITIQVIVVVIFSHFTYQYVERPSQRFFLKRLLPRRESVPTP